ncbi:hypothetical protein [Spiroplasma eriocheiris]|uniref:Transmembrane protein n=1 Tax=Spiroplasma eriocheiris TaxID=315358 RepID=A0A0H3XML2_9MOLU|nr:hypothetical protein [Spiroplasma eriocheiris]AHF57746.1 hypothetical protein SPE_0618 [Spiroplasma eriocheiris CCTCC M 207170]AKM54197.1 hypothetical protein SERIO_v1c06270 [Spiroplasma eriocheiris]
MKDISLNFLCQTCTQELTNKLSLIRETRPDFLKNLIFLEIKDKSLVELKEEYDIKIVLYLRCANRHFGLFVKSSLFAKQGVYKDIVLENVINNETNNIPTPEPSEFKLTPSPVEEPVPELTPNLTPEPIVNDNSNKNIKENSKNDSNHMMRKFFIQYNNYLNKRFKNWWYLFWTFLGVLILLSAGVVITVWQVGQHSGQKQQTVININQFSGDYTTNQYIVDDILLAIN